MGVQPTRSEILLSTIAPGARGRAVQISARIGLRVHRLRRAKPCQHKNMHRRRRSPPLTKDLSQASKGEDDANAILVQQLRKLAAPKCQFEAGKERDVGPSHGLGRKGVKKLGLSLPLLAGHTCCPSQLPGQHTHVIRKHEADGRLELLQRGERHLQKVWRWRWRVVPGRCDDCLWQKAGERSAEGGAKKTVSFRRPPTFLIAFELRHQGQDNHANNASASDGGEERRPAAEVLR